jgi:hypothetical protein
MSFRLWFLAAGLALMLTGCATHYDVTLQNGDVIRARTKPALDDEGQYVFQDLAGQPTQINRMRVRQIQPVRRGSRPTPPF